MLKNKYIENENNNIKFNLDEELKCAVNIYNNTKHSTTGYAPSFLFNCRDKKIYDIVKSKTIKSQKNQKINNNINLENQFAILSENFKLYGDKIKTLSFGGKGRYLIPIKIIKAISSNEYKIILNFNHRNLSKGKNYFVDFKLIKLCTKEMWNELLKDYI